MSNLSVTSRLSQVKETIRACCLKNNRSESDITLVAVSKTKPGSAIEEAYRAGSRHFGENYVQELVTKASQLTLPDIQWHFIGPLQSNKTRAVAAHCHWVHTIDRYKIAQRLSDQRPAEMPALKVLIQVNISDDPAKAGILPSQIERLADQIADLPHLELKGLMTITAAGLDAASLETQFRELKNHQNALISRHPDCTEVSMGMSQDYELAIACGSTMVRVGSQIFGPRTPPPSQRSMS